jgi:hypothetical protein
MAKTTSARREAPRTVTAEELAEENKRALIAESGPPFPDENGNRTPPKPEPEFALKVEEVEGYDNLLDHLAKGEWIPQAPEAVGAALRILGDEALASLDFRAEEHDEIKWLKQRLALLEQRLDPANDYSQSDGDEPNALDGLWLTSHIGADNSSRLGPEGEDDAEVIPDIRHRRLRPTTWAQLCDILVVFADDVESRYKADDEQATATDHLQVLVSNLSRAVMAPASRPAHDIAEAFVMESITRLESDREHREANSLDLMWRFIELYGQGRDKEAWELGKNWKLVRSVD